jgi:hypothetical protein
MKGEASAKSVDLLRAGDQLPKVKDLAAGRGRHNHHYVGAQV